MAVKAGDLESDLVEAVVQGVRARLPDRQAELGEAFVRQYYRWVPAADLAGRSAEDLLGAALAHFEHAGTRPAHQTKVRVFNPEPERDGFASPYTVVEIVSDDMPFIVDSVTMELGRQGHTIQLAIHPVIRVCRDDEGRLLEVLPSDAEAPTAAAESVLRAELDREQDPAQLEGLRQGIHRVLDQVRAVVEDWPDMRQRALELADELDRHPEPREPAEAQEGGEFLRWVAADHFTFLGYREYDLVEEGSGAALKVRPGTGRGILRGAPATATKRLPQRTADLARRPSALVLTKANSRATVHRPVRLDYIGVKQFGRDGRVIGEQRFLGLYTTSAYRTSPVDIPLLRGKVQSVLDRAGFPAASHDRKALQEILETYPRDALVQIERQDLFRLAMGLLGLGERPRVRLFAWVDPMDRFVACTVTLPRDRFNTQNRERAERILMEAFGGTALDYTLQLSESVVVRLDYTVWCDDGPPADVEVARVEAEIAQAVRGWEEDLTEALQAEHGPGRGTELARRYAEGFPGGYRSDCRPQRAVEDIAQLERLEESGGVSLQLYSPEGESRGLLRCRLYSIGAISLSDVLPTFEHMGAQVIDERPYRIRAAGSDGAWIYDFGLRVEIEDLERVRGLFQEAFIGAQRGRYEDDGLGGLVLRAALSGREIVVLRAVARYLRQAGIPYSDAYMERTLNAHPDIARLLVQLFIARFDPDRPRAELGEGLIRAMELAIEGVPSLDEDRILRRFLAVIRAVVRTSYFRSDRASEQRGWVSQPPPYVSLKLDPSRIPLVPRPRPQFEVFVYSPRFEAVHLRGGRVARGGIRWSDRPEDFRSEILGLMKAQMVKNALIVPVGAKGGFVVKPGRGGAAEDPREEAIACYRMFLSGLLDLTDNLIEGNPVPPERVVRYDEDDPYLVVAADKGTAEFSDSANQVSEAYGYWLGDAFASGGSRGYDHKKMGITARGAWESVKRHFRELGIDIQTTDFTVVGIGDMSGDVFGNAMLRSPHIRLVAAFNHQHIFLDPDPDPEAGFAERQRLFGLERSSWRDYSQDAISEGGGVHDRTAKSIQLTAQVQRALAVDADELSPPELIQAILRAPVDLLFNGGIGTYVKASSETHADAVDKANDALRVDGRQLRCAVVGEGGNLGFTQRARIEYAAVGGPEGQGGTAGGPPHPKGVVGGRIFTDSIDNVAGVNTSDHEVNIKILLDSLVRGEKISASERDRLLQEMTDSVAEQVLYGSYTQTQAISLTLAQASGMIDVHARLIRWLEQNAGLDRELEQLPDEEELSRRKSEHRGLLSPEVGVLMAHCKIGLYHQLLQSNLIEDEYLVGDIESYFPAPLPERFAAEMREHRLRREIVATVLANQLVDRCGTTFAFRLEEETGASAVLLAAAFAVAREVFHMTSFWHAVEALDNRVEAQVQLRMLIEGRKLTERSIRALVRDNPRRLDIAATVRRFQPGVRLLEEQLDGLLEGSELQALEDRVAELRGAGVPAELARWVAAMPAQPAVFDIVAVVAEGGADLEPATRAYFRLGSRLELNWLRERIVELPRANRWQALARSALREELLGAHRELTREVLEVAPTGSDPDQAIDHWASQNPDAVERSLSTLADIRASRVYDTTTLAVALREVRALTRRAD